MKEHPIIFNGEMVRAILAGKKTQTRRPIKPQPLPGIQFSHIADGKAYWYQQLPGDCSMNSINRCPFGKPGDQLWVRETFIPTGDGTTAWYKADAEEWGRYIPRWTPSIHMPRWACRIVLEVTNIRVELVQSISEADAKAEGCDNKGTEAAKFCGWYEVPRRAFWRIWEKVYPKSWEKNEWVWVVEFKKVSP